MKNKHPHAELGMRITPLRDGLIELFLNNPGIAFSESELNDITGKSFDRTTVYRTIRTLLNKVFIHKIVCEEGVLRYALNDKINVLRNHPHFQCTICGQVKCLQDQYIKDYPLPKGYEVMNVNLLIRGVCIHCNSDTSR